MSERARVAQRVRALAGRVIHIDLTTRLIEELPIDTDVYRRFLGGRGLNQYLLAKLLLGASRPEVEAIPVLISPGLLVGTSAPGAVRVNEIGRPQGRAP